MQFAGYKVRDRDTGLFSAAGDYKWSKTGKTWSGLGPLKLHLIMCGGRKYQGKNCEIVVFEIASRTEMSLDKLLRDIEETKRLKEEDRKARAA